MRNRKNYGKPAYRPSHQQSGSGSEWFVASSLRNLPRWLGLRGPVAEIKTNLKVGKRFKQLHIKQRATNRCSLEELNAILWPGGKPGHP